MEIIEAIRQRRSIREYQAKLVGKDILQKLIDAAIWAPSAMNRQLWFFTVVQDQNLLDRISREAKTYMMATEPSIPQHLKDTLKNPDLQIFYHAPALILISARSADEPWATEDCALAAENLMLAAYAEGLGTCWIGFAQKWLRTPEGKKVLDLPAECLPVAPIIIGYPKLAAEPVSRHEAKIHWI